MTNDGRRIERDLVLAPNEYAYLLDETKGNVINYVGPHKTSLANTDQPVVFNNKTKRFERCLLDQAIQPFAIAPEGWYLALKNPAQDGKFARPGAANSLPDLDVGRKVNIPGPVAFAPWPGQMVRVIQGHRLRTNQYLVVRVYEESAARENWAKAVIKPQSEGEIRLEAPDLTMGKLLIIKGTEVSFYIPPTGIEVVEDAAGHYVRDAVTLERLEYCILLNEDGNKRYIQGPDVVFPEPTETFIVRDGQVKFKAIELNEISGLYIKVIAPYEEQGHEYKVGDELFITGKDQMIYFPRPEHAIIRYGDREVIYATAIPAGEARYVLHRLTGQIELKRGPCMFLPDPREEVLVRRVLDARQVALWFPGNAEALEYNRRLMEMVRGQRQEFVQDREARDKLGEKKKESRLAAVAASEEFVGDEFSRPQGYTPPRTITLDTKYEGAVAVNVWTGYAVMVISKTGERRVAVGPQSVLLEYDETLEPVELSTGTPKSDNNLLKTVYLRVLYNKVSDEVEAETLDMCRVRVRLSYRVNFEGDPNRWFNVENYVKFLTDHMRSILSHAIRRCGIQHFYANAIGMVRDTVLGAPAPDDPSSRRPGRLFEENGMRIYDVEVLSVSIQDEAIGELLTEAQHHTVEQSLDVSAEQARLEATRQKEEVKQQVAQAEAVTQQLALDLQMEEVRKRLNLNLTEIESEVQARKTRLAAELADQQAMDQIHQAELARQKARTDLELAVAQQKLAQHIQELEAGVRAVVDKASAVSPDLVAALQAFSDKALAERMAESMAPLAILGGRSIADVFAQLLKGTVLEGVLARSSDQGD